MAFTCDEDCLAPLDFFDDGYSLLLYLDEETGKIVYTVIDRSGKAINDTRYAAVSERALTKILQ